MVKVANIIEDGRLAGPQLRIAAVSQLLRDYDFETDVILPINNSIQFREKLKKSGTTYYEFNLHRLTRSGSGLLTYFVFFLWEIILLWRHIRRKRYEIIHCSGGAWQIKGVIAGKFAGSTVIWHLNDTSMPIYIRCVFRLLSPLADGFVVAGTRVKTYYLSNFAINKPVFEIQAPVDTTVFDPGIPGLQKPIIDGSRLRVVTVCNVNPLKGLEDFIAMAAMLQNEFGQRLDYFIIGPIFDSQKKYAAQLKKRIVELQLSNVSFHGAAKNVPAMLKSADIYVCSSIAEASPTALWEAMAMKKAIVSTDVGDVRRFLQDDIAGYIVPVRDVYSMASAVARLVEAPSKRRRLGCAARKVVLKNLDLQVCAKKHSRMYTSILGEMISS